MTARNSMCARNVGNEAIVDLNIGEPQRHLGLAGQTASRLETRDDAKSFGALRNGEQLAHPKLDV